ncbi:hypothetical protein COCC4DRAFT_34941 [Bipolaris maydis ATCC 48331]|uniref:Uncharacterized protein n=2 Tax=Cochliobolus heterostrophus TaxID=5016 RepID=M2TTK5_COCH5|nr:uncharacterized protein COCC4DRAFT_34941 [Bipolaris maydis ATCC 48331]EMD85106.1 hypothetical protein COCHEDRAFT_1024669 [Bipolaris maydis C5]ENH99230.1 hypothetical protein COCC4DRAFT_34941 [Bipolaris maydis ATCC 48331]
MAETKSRHSGVAMLPHCANRWSKSLYNSLYIDEHKLCTCTLECDGTVGAGNYATSILQA